MRTVRVMINEHGKRIGQYHTNAKLTDHDCDLIIQLAEQGMSYSTIADKFDVTKGCICHIVTGRRRGQSIAREVLYCPETGKYL